jgi:hypothetical protein
MWRDQEGSRRIAAEKSPEKPEEGRCEANGPVAQIAFPSNSTLPSPFQDRGITGTVCLRSLSSLTGRIWMSCDYGTLLTREVRLLSRFLLD